MDPLEPTYRVCPVCGWVRHRYWYIPLVWEDKRCVICGTSMTLKDTLHQEGVIDAEELQKVKANGGR